MHVSRVHGTPAWDVTERLPAISLTFGPGHPREYACPCPHVLRKYGSLRRNPVGRPPTLSPASCLC
eukprot:1078011-Prymnesium_polylepis.1